MQQSWQDSTLQYKWTMTQSLMYEHSEQFEDQEEESAAVSKTLTWFHRLSCCKGKHHKRGIVLASRCFQIIFDNKKNYHYIWDYKMLCVEVVAIA